MTRQRNNIQLPIIRKNYFLKSFIPSSIRLWNDLSDSLRKTDDIDTYRNMLKKTYTPDLLYKPYLYGHTKEFIHLSRLRMGLSGLNAHRKQYHFINVGTCPNCQYRNKNTIHYLFQNLSGFMPQIQQQLQSLQTVPRRKLLSNKLLFGTQNKKGDIKMFTYVANFIKESK